MYSKGIVFQVRKNIDMLLIHACIFLQEQESDQLCFSKCFSRRVQFGQGFQDELHLNGRHILFDQHKCFEVVCLISLRRLKHQFETFENREISYKTL